MTGVKSAINSSHASRGQTERVRRGKSATLRPVAAAANKTRTGAPRAMTRRRSRASVERFTGKRDAALIEPSGLPGKWAAYGSVLGIGYTWAPKKQRTGLGLAVMPDARAHPFQPSDLRRTTVLRTLREVGGRQSPGIGRQRPPSTSPRGRLHGRRHQFQAQEAGRRVGRQAEGPPLVLGRDVHGLRRNDHLLPASEILGRENSEQGAGFAP